MLQTPVSVLCKRPPWKNQSTQSVEEFLGLTQDLKITKYHKQILQDRKLTIINMSRRLESSGQKTSKAQ